MTSHRSVTHSPSSFHTLLEQHRWPWHFLNGRNSHSYGGLQIFCISLGNIAECLDMIGKQLVIHHTDFADLQVTTAQYSNGT